MTQRIQLSRKKGFRKPPGCIVVSRPSKWGNPFNWQDLTDVISAKTAKGLAAVDYKRWLDGTWPDYLPDRRQWILEHLDDIRQAEFIGCWCGPNEFCHGDVLIRLAEAKK